MELWSKLRNYSFNKHKHFWLLTVGYKHSQNDLNVNLIFRKIVKRCKKYFQKTIVLFVKLVWQVFNSAL